MTDINEHDVYVLTDDQIDIIDHAMRRTYLFDGYDALVTFAGESEAQEVAETFRALGFNDVGEYDEDCDGNCSPTHGGIMTERDHNVCEANEDGRHGPIGHNFEDYDISIDFVSVRCEACGESTGYEIARFAEDLEWN